MEYRKFNDEVLYPKERFVSLDTANLNFLKTEASKNPRQRIRLCAHQGTDDKIHEMFIIHGRDAYVRPHKHINKSESLFLIEGEVDVIFFDEQGSVIKKIEMGDARSGKKFYYRLSEPLYHTLCIKSDVICFYEVTEGPFNRADTVFPSWAPDGEDKKSAEAFMKKIGV